MVAAGGRGAIVVHDLDQRFWVEETMAAYNVTKAAVWAFIRSAAIDLGPPRHPGQRRRAGRGRHAAGRAGRRTTEQLAPQYLRTIPLGRFAQPVDVANAALFLASDEAAYITGQTIVIDGGQTLGIRGRDGPHDSRTGPG